MSEFRPGDAEEAVAFGGFVQVVEDLLAVGFPLAECGHGRVLSCVVCAPVRQVSSAWAPVPTLAPGQALFARPRTLHAYLRGTGVEIMANSDNVLRGGLTAKHIDLAELLAVTDFTPSTAELVRAVDLANGEDLYPTPAAQFQLTRIRRGVEINAPGPGALLCVEGELTGERGSARETPRRGEALFIRAAGGPLRVGGTGLAFRAAVPS
ncbi:hypothetical protein ACFWNT_44180 [Streptomyces sp. NPDC058409]|uniref:hypothetical protein n=1 Tax=Streptomyces sp. NPDC058409 TaxID=3346484 RepID=UPI00364D1496